MQNKKTYDTLVFVGRFQPLHNAHLEIMRRACELSRELIVIIGSSRQPRTYKNPFSFTERKMMVNNALDIIDTANCRVSIEENVDTIYDDQAWASRVQTIVSNNRLLHGPIGIIGHKKDKSSKYLDMFPQWILEDVNLIEPLHAVNIRDLYFRRNCNLNFIRSVVPEPTFNLLEGWKDTLEYLQVIAEREFIDNYRKQWSNSPYEVIFNTVDALVVQSGHVLLIKRRAEPGRGLWAMPGGYINASTDNSVRDAMIRELKEETGLKVPEPVLIGNIVHSCIFDAIDRSPRGRIITHCFKIVLPAGELPKVRGMDDAVKAQWVPISEVKSENMFEDHFQIISKMLGE